MKEFKNIIETYNQVDFSERKAALATVVQVKGSSYRNPGARMLMLDNGRWVGSISGGCLEGDALRKAKEVILNKTPRTVIYDTSNDDDNQLGIGLGCNGIIDILIEPIDPESADNPINLMQSFLTFENTGVIATIFEATVESNTSVGEKVLLKPNGTIQGNNDGLNALLHKPLISVLENQKSEIQVFKFNKGKIKAFLEIIQPSIDLLIFGGGFDAKPVTELAAVLGWNVRVSDECVAHLVPINFPKANQMLTCKRELVQKEIKITPFTAIVLMSHDFNYDKEVLSQILDSAAPYIGILGPKSRADKLFSALKDEYKIELSQHHLEKLHYPIGLDIGAETPDEIAVSIIGEIQARFTSRSGGLLKYRSGTIHQRDGKEDQVFKQVYLKHFFEKRKSN